MTECGPNCPVVKEQLRNLVGKSPWLQEKYGRKTGERTPSPTTPALQEVATSTPSIHVAKEARFPGEKREEPEGEELKEQRTNHRIGEGFQSEVDFRSEPRIISEAQSRSQQSYAIEDSSRLRPGEFKREPFVKPKHSRYPGSSYPGKQGSYTGDTDTFERSERRPVTSATSFDGEEIQSEEDFEPEAWEDSLISGDQDFDPIAQSTPKHRSKGRDPRRTFESEEGQDFYEGTVRMEKSASANLETGPSKSSQRARTGKGQPAGRGHKPRGKDELPGSSSRQPDGRGYEDLSRPPAKSRRPRKPGERMRESELCELEDDCDFDNVCLCRMHCVIRGLRKYSFVRSMIAAAVLFTIGLKLCAELDAWSLPTRVG